MDMHYSLNNEDFDYDSPDDALQAMDDAGELEEGRVYYEVDSEPVTFDRYLAADRLLETAEEWMYDEIGECAEDAFATSDEATAELDALLKAWSAKHLSGTYWRGVGWVRELKVTADDVASFAT